MSDLHEQARAFIAVPGLWVDGIAIIRDLDAALTKAERERDEALAALPGLIDNLRWHGPRETRDKVIAREPDVTSVEAIEAAERLLVRDSALVGSEVRG